MIKLDTRLNSIASLVDKNIIIADIGTDHGYLPIYLCLNNVANYAYACDVAQLPLNKAIENIDRFGLNKKIKPILTDGLNNLPKEIDIVIVAGMGGHLISKIIENSNYETLILQPNLHAEIVRDTLMRNNYKIIDEKVVKDHKKYYEIIKAKKGKINYTLEQIKYGPVNLIEKSSGFIAKYEEKIKSLKLALNQFDDTSSNGYKKIVCEIDELNEIIKK